MKKMKKKKKKERRESGESVWFEDKCQQYYTITLYYYLFLRPFLEKQN